MGNNLISNIDELYSGMTPQQKKDSYYERNITIYDNFPYVRDQDICNSDYLEQDESNVIKYYKYDAMDYRAIDAVALHTHK